jgi:hypothetical protein
VLQGSSSKTLDRRFQPEPQTLTRVTAMEVEEN